MNKLTSKNYENLIIKDRYLLIIDNKGYRRFCNLNMQKIRLGKKEIFLNFLENQMINTFWDCNTKPYNQISTKEFFDLDIDYDDDEEINNSQDVRQNNKEIYSEGAQTLTKEKIEELKEKGIKGDELIKIILDNNTSMEKRTIFSKEKVLRRKERIYKHKIWVAPTNLFNIIETIFIEDAKKIKYKYIITTSYMRMDSVSTMLCYSVFYNNSKTLIYEDTENILTSAYASRSSSKSQMVSLFNGKINNRNLTLFNLNLKTKKIITYIDFQFLTNKDSIFYDVISKKYMNYFENLVISIKNEIDLLKIVFQLYDYLRYSGNLIVFSEEIEPLVALEKILFEEKFGIDNKIHETFLREFQVLPSRTHPMMNNKGFSGYILTSIKTRS